MAGIVCAIRGGPASRSTIEAATALAVRVRQPLHLLYVVNANFLSQTTSSRLHPVLDDMRQMGELILTLARQSAEARGADVETAIRTGDVAEEIVALCQALDADYVVVGKPVMRGGPNVFSTQKLDLTVERIRAACRAEVLVVNGDSV